MPGSKISSKGGLPKSGLSKAQTESKLNSLLSIKSSSKTCLGKKHKLKSKPAIQKDGTDISRKRTTDSLIESPRKDSSKKKITTNSIIKGPRNDSSKRKRTVNSSIKGPRNDSSKRKRTTNSSIKGPRKDSSEEKLIITIRLNKTGGKSSLKLSSKTKKDQGEKTSVSSRKNVKEDDEENPQKHQGKSSLKLSSKTKKHQGEKVSASSRKNVKDVDGEENPQKRKRKRRKKKQRNNADLDDASRLKRRTRYLLIKMKLEQNLIDAYSAEGWKGQSREKIRPEKELQRAHMQILKCKLSIRDAIRQLDSLSSLSSIEDSAIAPDGSTYPEQMYCQKCKLREAIPDNDIIHCDGTCNRAFHQKCLDPPLDNENDPPGEHGWLCKFCECKVDILEVMNAHLGTHFSMHSTWQDVFKEEAAKPDGDTAFLNSGEEWPSDDSEDDDYDPERREDCHNINKEGSSDNVSDDLSSSTSLCSSDGECSLIDEGVNHEYLSVNGCIGSDESEEKVTGPRQRKAVDYKKLYDEMFGKDAATCEQVSEDEDWGPSKRKRREKESDAISTLMSLHKSQNKNPDNEHKNMNKEDSSGIQIKRPCFRIPPDSVEKLRQAFAENELPSRSIKEALSKELGLGIEKVSKWFKNARYTALKSRKQNGEEADQVQKQTSKNHSGSQNPENAELSKSKASKSQKNVEIAAGRKKRQRKISSPQPKENGNKDLEELSDDVCLKNLLKDIKKKRVKFAFEGDSHAAELEFERLSKVKTKLDNIRQKLTAILNHRGNGSDESQSNEPSIIYVPTAVIREKVE